jgi:hypothetical protein
MAEPQGGVSLLLRQTNRKIGLVRRELRKQNRKSAPAKKVAANGLKLFPWSSFHSTMGTILFKSRTALS